MNDGVKKMSDVMLHAVLRMPPHLWINDDLDQFQRYQRYLEASNKIQSMEDVVAAAEKVCRNYLELFDAITHLDECINVYRSGLQSNKEIE
jgi:hypothetical protein